MTLGRLDGARRVGLRLETVPAATILVVDDEVDVREIVGEVLTDAGYAVRLAADGREGLALALETPRPAAMLLDLVMPVMTGNELFARLRTDARTLDLPVVVMTSDASRAPSGVPVLQKPVGIATLLAALASALAER